MLNMITEKKYFAIAVKCFSTWLLIYQKKQRKEIEIKQYRSHNKTNLIFYCIRKNILKVIY